MNEIKQIIESAQKLISLGEPFNFWELLEHGEKHIENLVSHNSGAIEEGVIVKGKLFLGKGSHIKAFTRIEGNVYVGENCIIGPNAFLRNGTIIADNCHIGTTEIKNSIILSGTKIPHFSYVGDSVIGSDCNLGGGTKVANLRHDLMTVKVKIGGKMVDSKRRKLGALLFNEVKTGVNSSINCGAIVRAGERILPNEFRK